MKRKLLQRRFICALIIFTICLGVLSQGMCVFANNADKKVRKTLGDYSEEELNAMSEEDAYLLFEDENDIDYSEEDLADISLPRSLPDKSVANAVFLRSYVEEKISTNPDKYGCMQNFAVFKYNNDSYFVHSMAGITGNAKIYIERRSYYGNTAMTFGANPYTEGQNKISYDGHGDSVEIVDHNGSKYIMYIEGTPYGTGNARTIIGPYYLKCRELLFDSTGDVSLGTEKTLNLFPTFDGKSAFDGKVAASDNYLCISIAYGNDIYSDRERYMVYGKDAFIDALYNGATSQTNSSIQNCRYATGWFMSNDSIGFIVPRDRTVLQSLCLDEKKDANGNLEDFIVIAAIDDRGTNSSNEHKVHYINRAYIEPKTPGSQASKAGQNMKDIHCYYSKITHIAYSGNTVNLEHDLSTKLGTGDDAKRTELEGMKKIKAQGNGITAGWYVSTHNGAIKNRFVTLGDMPYFGNMPDFTSNTVPWNSLVYKPQMTPVQVWS